MADRSVGQSASVRRLGSSSRAKRAEREGGAAGEATGRTPIAPSYTRAGRTRRYDQHDGYVDTDQPTDTSIPTSTTDTSITDEHEFELPSGTRRVSHSESVAASEADAAPKADPARRRPPKVSRRELGGPSVPATPDRRIRLDPGAGRGRRADLVPDSAVSALPGLAHGRVTVEIPAHTSSSKIGDLLARDGVISSSFFFELRATLDGERSDLRAGVYHLQQGMSYGAVLTALTKAPPAARVSELTITEGRTRHQISALLRAQHVPGTIWRKRGVRRCSTPGSTSPPPPAVARSFLFPDTYQLWSRSRPPRWSPTSCGPSSFNSPGSTSATPAQAPDPYEGGSRSLRWSRAEASTERARPWCIRDLQPAHRRDDAQPRLHDSLATGNYTRR